MSIYMRFPLSIVVAIVLFFGVSCSQKRSSELNANQGNELIIGEVASMTGIEATYGLGAHQGIALAFQEINSLGGIRNKKLKLITLDSQGKPDESARAITKLISQDQALVIVSGVISSNALAMAPIAQHNKIPLIATIATHPKITEQGEYIFRTCLMDSIQGQVMAKFVLDHLKLRKVAILKDIKSDYSIGLAETFASVLQSQHGEIGLEQVYSAGDIDFKSQLTAIRSKNPEAIYIPGYYTDVSLIARQARELGIKVPLLGGDGWDSPKLKEIGGSALGGSYFSGFYSPDAPAARLKNFISNYQRAYGTIPDGLAVMGYEGAQILFDALKRAQTLDSQGIRDALALTKKVETLTGEVSINEKRNANRSAVILMIQKEGNIKYQATLNEEMK